MSGTRIALDGLWRCLCPSVDEQALSRALRSPTPSQWRSISRPPRRRPSTSCTAAQWGPRSFHTTSRRCNASASEAQAAPASSTFSGTSRHDGKGQDQSVTVDALLAGPALPRDLLHRAPTPVLYDALRAMQAQPRRRPHLRALVKYLVEHRAQTPNAFLYEALVASNWEAAAGSAAEVRQILDEMRDLGVGATSSLYHAALRALAVHPDYLLRNRVVAEMRERWLELTPAGHCSVALGLLRDGQLELALDKLDDMADRAVPLPGWLLDVFTVVLAQHGHLDEALALLQRRTAGHENNNNNNNNDTRKLSPNIWAFFLDECSRQYHYAGTRTAWDAVVGSSSSPTTTPLLAPSDGTCLHVLNTAARHGDAGLAAAALSRLRARGVRPGPHHVEALADSHAHRDDAAAALRVLCAPGGVAPSRAATRSLRAALRRAGPAQARVARDEVLGLARTGGRAAVPLAVFDVVLEGLLLPPPPRPGGGDGDGVEAEAEADPEAEEEALALYRLVRHVCGRGPGADTFAVFMDRWTGPGREGGDEGGGREASARAARTRFLWHEMRAFGVRPTGGFCERVVWDCAVGGDLEGAFEVLREMEVRMQEAREEAEGWIGRETALVLVRRCVAERDERVWGLLETARRVGLDLGPAGRALAESAGGIGDGVGKLEETTEGQNVERQGQPWLSDEFLRKTTDGDVGSA